MTIQHMLLTLGGVVGEYVEPPPTPGIALSWGCNTCALLGDNTAFNRSSPGLVSGGFTDWTQISAGREHNVAVRSNGTAWAWGQGGLEGKLGDNSSSVAKSSPVQVVGGFTDWTQVSAGRNHNVGLRSNGTAWAWGENFNGILGDGTNTTRSSPVPVTGGFTDWTQVSAASSHNLGLRSNGTIWAWGCNNGARLGDGTCINRSSPVLVLGGFTDWTQVSGGGATSFGLRSNGTAWGWGINIFGELGDNTITGKSSPVQVSGGFTDWTQINGGGTHTLGIRANGTAWAWGRGAGGKLGTNQVLDTSSPVQVVGGFTDWTKIDGGAYHTVGIRSNGTAWAWGCNNTGMLGDNTIISKSSPVQVAGGFTDWIQVSAGTCIGLGLRDT